MFGLGAGELFLIFLIALFFLGPKKLPELAKGLGSAVREFNKAKDHMMQEINRHENEIKNDIKPDIKTDSEVVSPKLADHLNNSNNTNPHHDEDEIVTKKPGSHS